MKKTVLAFVSLMSCVVHCGAQGIDAELYQYNYSLIHPAFAGREGQKISMLVNTSTYSGGFSKGANTLALLSYEKEFGKINSGIAFTGSSQSLGPSSITSLGISYNYRFKFSETVNFIPGAKFRYDTYTVDFGSLDLLDPNDPILDADASEVNWVGDFGLLLQVKKFNFGLLANNLVHTNDKADGVASNNHLDRFYTAIAQTTFKYNNRLTSMHSLYISLEEDEHRIDVNNTVIFNDIFIAGLSLESTKREVYTRVNAGFKIKDYFQLVFLVYSKKREERDSDFRGEAYMNFKF